MKNYRGKLLFIIMSGYRLVGLSELGPTETSDFALLQNKDILTSSGCIQWLACGGNNNSTVLFFVQSFIVSTEL